MSRRLPAWKNAFLCNLKFGTNDKDGENFKFIKLNKLIFKTKCQESLPTTDQSVHRKEKATKTRALQRDT